MRDPKNLPLIYIISGVVAIVAAIIFMAVAEPSVFDWVILAMGVVAIVRGVQEHLKLRNATDPKAKN